MRLIALLAKTVASCGIVGAAIGSLLHYTVEYWGSHSGMLMGLLDRQTIGLAASTLTGNLHAVFWIFFPMALLASLLACVLLLIGSTFYQLSVPFILLAGLLAGGLLASSMMLGGRIELGLPFYVGASSGGLTGLFLSQKLLQWFSLFKASIRE
jgi:hypothetical protein